MILTNLQKKRKGKFIKIFQEEAGFRRCGDDLLSLRGENKQRRAQRETLTAVQGTHRAHKERKSLPQERKPALCPWLFSTRRESGSLPPVYAVMPVMPLF
ncbi:MAG: hypothetical protein LUH13_04920 [Oscillospiraceae bacterium]|nr:hypothetical protein [Oscillospiraceae bacterium]